MTISVPDTLVYVDSAAGLNSLIEEMCEKAVVAFDLEADSMFHFREKVCLIQAATDTANYIIDPLSIPDVSPLARVLSDPAIVKIFHGADYDVRSLFRDFEIVICNLFDTELASRFLGNAETGLNTVLCNRFNIRLEKKYQKKDWSQRPLPAPMIAYAAKDVQYLIPLYTAQKQELSDMGRLEWVEEECRDLTQVRAAPLNERPLFVRVKGAGRFESRSLAILEALLEFRLKVAEAKDRPLFKVIGNSALCKIAAARPATMEDLVAARALSDKQISMYGHQILTHVRSALAIPAARLPRYPRHRSPRTSNDVSARFKHLKQWREQKAAALKLDPGVLINNAVLKSIAEAAPRNFDALDAVNGLKHWQKKTLGDEIIASLARMPEELTCA